LKKSLALAFGDDIEGFRNAKHAFVKTVTEKARSEFGHASGMRDTQSCR
jgi:hypothetical protein